MLEPAAIVLRFAQYAGTAILLGSSLFLLYALPSRGPAAALRWPRRLLIAAGVTMGASALLGLGVQASLLAGSLADGLKTDILAAVIGGMDLGKAAVARALIAGASVVALVAIQPGRTAWSVTALLGLLAGATFPWMGHAGAAEGPSRALQIGADILHAWAAAAWIGALVCFLALLRPGPAEHDLTEATHRALKGFSGIGALLVALIFATGAINTWFLVGPARLNALWTTPYGQLLSLKLAAVLVMLGCAAANRFWLTPKLGLDLAAETATAGSLARLRRSVLLESFAGVLVLALVAWFGTLAPPAAM